MHLMNKNIIIATFIYCLNKMKAKLFELYARNINFIGQMDR